MEQKEKELQPQTRAYTVEEIAAILHIGRSSAYTLVKKGYFKSVRIGTAIRISRKSFDEWLEMTRSGQCRKSRPKLPLTTWASLP